jgi:hypothetical protein
VNGATDSRRGTYIHAVLAAYRRSPDVVGRVRAADRRFAVTLFERGVGLRLVEEALVLAIARRQAGNQPHEPIRSLHYFGPVIEELMRRPLPAGYADYLRQRLSPDPARREEPSDAGSENDGS